jgi:hypothetical protein
MRTAIARRRTPRFEDIFRVVATSGMLSTNSNTTAMATPAPVVMTRTLRINQDVQSSLPRALNVETYRMRTFWTAVEGTVTI